jgi:hypothetical protein
MHVHALHARSSGHSKRSDDGLCASGCNLTHGGKHSDHMHMRDSVLDAECIGKCHALMFFGEPDEMGDDGWQIVHDCKLKPGETQVFQFAAGDPPPVINVESGKSLAASDYIGKPKGMAQILFESGWWISPYDSGDLGKCTIRDGMYAGQEWNGTGTDLAPELRGKTMKGDLPAKWAINHPTETDPSKAERNDPCRRLYARFVLADRKDFYTEPSELEKIFLRRGHILTMSPKCHPEVAGHGIEFAWGIAKLFFRRNNDLVPAHFIKNVEAALNVVTRRRVFHCERRARDYRRALGTCDDDGNLPGTKEMIEKMRKEQKSHRDAGKFDAGYVGRLLAMDGGL